MVQTYQSPVRVYKHPFELVMAAYEKRFPTCQQIPIFVGSEILSEFRSPDGAEEVIERKCQLNVDAPYFVKKIAGVDYVYFNQKNSLDHRKRTLLIEASNISFASRLIIKENCCYYVHPDNEAWTCFEQSASLDVKSFFGFESVVEKLAVKQYGANLAKGKEVLEFFIEELLKSGINYVPRWTPPEGIELSATTSEGGEQPTAVQTASSASSDLDSTIDVGRADDDATTKPINAIRQNGDVRTGVHSADGLDVRRGSLSPAAGDVRCLSSASPPPASTSAARRPSATGVVRYVTRAVSTTHNAAPPALTASFDDPDDKLETEYIHRVLGPLTPLEESRLCELKYGLRAAHKGKMPNDAHLLRFLRACDFDLAKARDMLLASLLWRKQHNVDKILNDFVPSPVLVKYFPGGWHHHDLEDRPMFVLRLGQMDMKGILRSVGLEAVVKFTLSICEEGLVKAAEATRRIGKPISTWTLLVDLEGLSLRHVWRPGVQSLLRIIETVEAHYPETMGHLLIARAPRVFPVLWTLVSPFINENTRKKFIIHGGGGDTTVTEMAKYIDRQFIPDFLGGPCSFDVSAPKDGWLLPKSEYQPIDFEILLRESEQDILTSMYTTITVHRNMPHEVYVQVSAAGGVITWDFDVVKGECEFVVYFSRKTLKASAPPPASTPSGPVEFVTAAIGASSLLGGNSSTPADALVAANPQLRLGQDLRVVETTIAFSEGDSMQGSHFCRRTGTYILQWRMIDHHHSKHNGGEASTPQGTGGVIELAGHSTGGGSHKCKLMYYYELLDSEGFRGSVQSLESCRSSFSSLVAAGVDASH